jgi:hypothetical protein
MRVVPVVHLADLPLVSPKACNEDTFYWVLYVQQVACYIVFPCKEWLAHCIIADPIMICPLSPHGPAPQTGEFAFFPATGLRAPGPVLGHTWIVYWDARRSCSPRAVFKRS